MSDIHHSQHDVTRLDFGKAFFVHLDHYSGPLETLLALAREKQLDLLYIPLSTLVDQYLAFINEQKRLNLSVAFDYLIMAAWLTWLKSRLLLPKEEQEKDELPAYQQEERLRQRLHHYGLIQKYAEKLEQMPQKGYDFFPRGMPAQERAGR